eukprot:GHVP01003231.1.p1 GENE.GHVP01003231.1~~GHVP01003231.1.p1  ORF type:complete len:257 (-),score=48.42 GHVP01003231.1:12-782(-)
MEFKKLVDQLNIACEEYFRTPQESGFPVQDELYQENYCELESQAIRCKHGFLHGGKTVKIREKIIKKTIEEVFELKLTRYELKEFGTEVDKNEKYENLFIDDTTLFYFEEPENRPDKRRHWTVGLCNCKNWQKCRRGEKCREFKISWRKFLNIKHRRQAASKLWKAFELAPDIHEKKHILGDAEDCMDDDLFLEQLGYMWFNSWWKSIHTSNEVLSAGSDELSDELSAGSDELRDWLSDAPSDAPKRLLPNSLLWC